MCVFLTIFRDDIDDLLFNLTRNLIMVQNNNVHFILTKTYRSMFTLDEKEINIVNYWHYLKFFKHN